MLYAGNPGSAREKDFVAHLKTTFRQVDSTDYQTFREDQANGHDVVIFDWTSVYARDQDGKLIKGATDLVYPKVPEISEKYDRPTILIGCAGELIASSLKLKIDWRCLCLDNYAHGLATSHPLFHEPFNVAPTIESVPTPEDVLTSFYASKVSKSMQVWKVQAENFPVNDPGLLSNAHLFEDSPDTEIISAGGVSSRGTGSVALGRHGNFLLWGFSAPPSGMTAEGRLCFSNAVCYIKRFDRQRPVVRQAEKYPFWRQGALLTAQGAKASLNPELYKQKYSALAQSPEALEQSRKYEVSALKTTFPEAVRQRAATDPDIYLRWAQENFPWLRHGTENDDPFEIAVDDDARAVGPANSDVKLLDACVAMLERSDRPELALRVLKRYTTEDFADAKAWRTWLEGARDRIFFSEAGGYKFHVAPTSMIPPNRLPRLPLSTLTTPTRREPVVVELECTPSTAQAGKTLTVVVRVQTAALVAHHPTRRVDRSRSRHESDVDLARRRRDGGRLDHPEAESRP